MGIAELNSAVTLREACLQLLDAVTLLTHAPKADTMWRSEIRTYEIDGVLGAISGLPRIFFKSRDSDFLLLGFGVADIVQSPSEDSDAALSLLVEKAKTLYDDQVFFGGMRFDENRDVASEWQKFGKRLFILPLVMLLRKNGVLSIMVNFRHDAKINFSSWRDRVSTVLMALANRKSPMAVLPKPREFNYLPTKDGYAWNIHQALSAFLADPHHKKVVIGRRNTIVLDAPVDPSDLFMSLEDKSRHAFLFFLDSGEGHAFFGASPELLYRRHNNLIETESLAGTRARACDEFKDNQLRSELLLSTKDNQEHAFVSVHIEEKLKELGTTGLSSSNLEIMALTYVQHLQKRYRGMVADDADDKNILLALHPTPAVCGIDIEWARNFIRENEGFDRGFYAGPIGCVGNNYAEFAVAIRSALCDRQNVYVYAACGIVPGSIHNLEWEELDSKEKNLLSIFN